MHLLQGISKFILFSIFQNYHLVSKTKNLNRGFMKLSLWNENSISKIIEKKYYTRNLPWYVLIENQWIELNVGALGNEGVPKLAGSLTHQLQY
jgi:hypothetical protein